MLEDKAKELFVVHAPLIAAGSLRHLVATVDFFKALFAAKFADPLPA